jgi:DNA-binding NtrC family response regulator
MPLVMPPLRERGGDVAELAEAFLRRLNRQYGAQTVPKRFDPDFLPALQRYSWPGNVRELEHFVQREYLMCEGQVIRSGPPQDMPELPATAGDDAAFKQAKARAIADFERSYVASAMARARGNITQAARMAGQDRSAFSKLVSKYRLASVAGQEQDSGE